MIDALMTLRLFGIWAGVLPLVACAVLILRASMWEDHGPPSRDVILLCYALAISFVADIYAEGMRAEGVENLWITWLYAPIQFGLLALIVSTPGVSQRLVVLGIVVLAAASFMTDALFHSEVLVRVGAGLWVGLAAYRHAGLGVYRWPLVMYCAASTPFVLALGIVEPAIAWPWITSWVGYKLISITALAWLTWAVVRMPNLSIVEIGGRRLPLMAYVPLRGGRAR